MGRIASAGRRDAAYNDPRAARPVDSEPSLKELSDRLRGRRQHLVLGKHDEFLQVMHDVANQVECRDGHREILGLDVTTYEDGAGWLTFFRGLTARGLSGVKLLTSDAHAGLIAAIGATLPGASWQRCRTHYAVNLMSVTPKSSWPWVKTLLHSSTTNPTRNPLPRRPIE